MADRRRRTSLDAWADRRVDDAHLIASRRCVVAVDPNGAAAYEPVNPVAFLRAEQIDAERVYCATGGKRELALVRAFARSLDGG